MALIIICKLIGSEMIPPLLPLVQDKLLHPKYMTHTSCPHPLHLHRHTPSHLHPHIFTLTSSPSHLHLHPHIFIFTLTSSSSPSHLHPHIFTLTSSPSHLHPHIFTLASSPSHLHPRIFLVRPRVHPSPIIHTLSHARISPSHPPHHPYTLTHTYLTLTSSPSPIHSYTHISHPHISTSSQGVGSQEGHHGDAPLPDTKPRPCLSPGGRLPKNSQRP